MTDPYEGTGPGPWPEYAVTTAARQIRCTCVPHGLPNYEGPMRDCPIHGEIEYTVRAVLTALANSAYERATAAVHITDTDAGYVVPQPEVASTPWRPSFLPEEDQSLHAAVRQAVGSASMAWVGGTGDAVFDNDEALRVADGLVAWIESRYQLFDQVTDRG